MLLQNKLKNKIRIELSKINFRLPPPPPITEISAWTIEMFYLSDMDLDLVFPTRPSRGTASPNS